MLPTSWNEHALPTFRRSESETPRRRRARAAFLSIHAQYAESEALLREELLLIEKAMGSDHPQIAFALANVLREVKQDNEALGLYERSRQVAEGMDENHPFMPVLLEAYVGLLREMGDEERAAELEGRLRELG